MLTSLLIDLNKINLPFIEFHNDLIYRAMSIPELLLLHGATYKFKCIHNAYCDSEFANVLSIFWASKGYKKLVVHKRIKTKFARFLFSSKGFILKVAHMY